ncbi:gliding motility-associated C-terminal domain-containing protein [bacterium]|nr:gliding motility-associated C-terminal domain-containing protein [bacterium]
MVTNISFKAVTCYEGSNGEAYFSVSGGNTPYAYKWSNEEITPDILNLVAGEYSVVVADSNGCTEKATIEVTQAEELVIDYNVSIVSCKDDNDGAINIDVTGGHGEYAYSWSNGASSQDLNDLLGDTYTITVTDDSSCVKEVSIPVAVNPVICINIPSAFSPNGDDINDQWIITNSELYPELSLEVFNRWGTIVYHSKQGYDSENLWDGTFHGQELPSDTYYYILLTNNGDEPFTGGISIIR